MTNKARPLTHEDIEKAQILVKNFGWADIHNLPYEDQLDLVKTHYSRIRGRPIEAIPQNQLYRIAERLYYQSHQIVSRIRRGENLEGTLLS